MADSLQLGGLIELLGGGQGVVSSLPLCSGATFTVSPGFTMGSPQPIVDIVQSLVLNGERPYGTRASNRTITLPVSITAPDRTTLAGAIETLLQLIDQQTWTLQWTRDPGDGTPLPLLLDCFRANPSKPVYNLIDAQQFSADIEIEFQALPYGRSDVASQLTFASPISGTSPPPPPVTLDNFATVTSLQFWTQSSITVTGSWSARFDNLSSYYDPAANYSNDSLGGLDITGLTSLGLWVGAGSPYYDYYSGLGGFTFTFILTDSSENVLAFGLSQNITVSESQSAPAWTYLTVPIPQGAVFDYTSVAAYSFLAWNSTSGGYSGSAESVQNVVVFLNDLQAIPASGNPVASVRGSVYTLAGVTGTAPAPVSLQFQLPPDGEPGTETFSSGSGIWTCPDGVTSVKAELTGPGGAGASMTVSGQGGGGGGGEYACEPAYPVVPGDTYAWTVGTPGHASTFDGTGVVANPGASAAANSATGGHGGSGGSSTVTYAGGAGAEGTDGGASASFSSTGTWTAPSGVFSVTASCWAGGGSGGSSEHYYYGLQAAGGGGGGGFSTGTVSVTPGTVYAVTVGPGGAASSGDSSGSAGGTSAFTGDSGTVTAAGGSGGGSSSAGGGFGAGGTGSTYSGGAGAPGGKYDGGCGGGGAGSAGAGAAAVNTGASPGGAGGAGGGGNGGEGGLTSGGGSSGGNYGGGGGGAGTSPDSGTDLAGLAGGHGFVQLVYGTGGNGGGGGSSGGSSSPGNPGSASSDAGGGAVTGGGAGGNGAAAASGAGSAGSSPGGGGGGGWSSGSAAAGGAGAAGQVKLTYYGGGDPTFSTLIAHRPGPDAPASLNPLIPVGSGGDVPNGETLYPIPSLVTGVPALFGGTYSVMLTAETWASPSTSRTVTVTVYQYEYAGGPSTQWPVSWTFEPASQVTNGMVTLGELTLPGADIAPDNTQAYFEISVTSTEAGDRFLDCLMLDSMGETCWVNLPDSAYATFYIDQPTADRDLGRVLGSAGGRPEALSVMASTFVSGGPLTVDPGANTLMVYSLQGAPSLAAYYWPAWYIDRLS